MPDVNWNELVFEAIYTENVRLRMVLDLIARGRCYPRAYDCPHCLAREALKGITN